MKLLGLLILMAVVSFAKTCDNCHEIAPTIQQWQKSSHRNVDCEQCHGGTFQGANVRRVVTHMRGTVPDQLRLTFVQVKEVVERCRSCHQQEFAAWNNGPHGVGYSKIFVDQKHNATRALMDDCLRCHGMFFEGGIRDLVKNKTTLAQPWLANVPSIPCLACHSIHMDGEPHRKDVKRPVGQSVAFWDRRSGEHIRPEALVIPVMREGTRAVKMSPDRRQGLCYQCHAPLATAQVWSGDDRTPLGVHEGISCLACHGRHTQDARASCATCHPRLSNCGLDVEKMDTTFANAKSRHNVHTVKCVDCHEKGVPKMARAGR